MTKKLMTIHARFRLNGVSYSRTDLEALAYDLVKEGKPFEQKIGDFLLNWLDDKPTIEVKTSGSTGTPKPMLLQKQQMINSALATGYFFNLQKEETALLCLPADYIAGKMMLVRAMVLGLDVDYVAPTSKPLNGILKNYDFAAMVPLQLENSLGQIHLVKTLLVGGAAVSRELKKELQDKRVAVFETYGMTETITHIAVRRINDSSLGNTPDVGKNYFSAMPHVILATDDRNCLVINAPKVCGIPVITNDMVNLISETTFEWLGRYDNVINSGGIKLFPEQIEAKLTFIIEQPFFVTGGEDKVLGQKLILVVQGAGDSENLLSKVKKTKALQPYEIPKNVYFLSQFVTTDNGKIRRTETLKLLQA